MSVCFSQPTQTDEVFQILLNNIDIESKIALRQVMCMQLYIQYVYVYRVVVYSVRAGIYCLRQPLYRPAWDIHSQAYEGVYHIMHIVTLEMYAA